MKWEMEVYEIEAVLEKIWDLHDKLSDAIHSVSRSHFLNSVKSRNKLDDFRSNQKADNNQVKAGYVYVKEFRVDEDDESAVHEAKSLNAIRSALEHLEDQLEFFHAQVVVQCLGDGQSFGYWPGLISFGLPNR
ncbi:Plastid division protein PDV1 [Capsicum annuum]|nr:Plastid division protein PDV1 [Capsicum annuum]KAF3660455.1 Plastid division protein PDV1 [Capsicum annuum]